MADHPTLAEQVSHAVLVFRQTFGRLPTVAAAAPGRVNLIGEHTDYNDGFVSPIAIERQTLIVADRAPGGRDARSTAPGRRARLVSTDLPGEACFEVAGGLAPGEPAWANYVRGVVAGCLERGIDPGGFDAVVSSTVPVGGGLSSSAALEVATATLLEAMTGYTLDPVEKALLCQHAEHTFAGMPCGIMDQFISVMGRADHALLLDCRSHAVDLVPLADPRVVVLIANTNVKHELTGGEYAERRAQCEAAAKALGVHALRDVTLNTLQAARDRLDPLVYRRARHVVSENQRTLAARDAMRQGQWPALGALMYQSHESLRADFEVSCPELDTLVDLAGQLGEAGGVYGARMTGGGFGGCTVSLVRAAKVEQVTARLHEGYAKATGIEPTIFPTRPADGARVVRV